MAVRRTGPEAFYVRECSAAPQVSFLVMTLDIFPVVLVVDDDRGQLAILASVLQNAGFRVLSANSALAALAALDVRGAANEELAILVTDLDMPGMSGRALAAELVTKHPKLKVLYVTANADALFRQGRELEAHEAFLEKPVSAQELREAVNVLLRPSSTPFRQGR
jgi:two-component system cell cycle sensor histidine kinase/response regulator CckA